MRSFAAFTMTSPDQHVMSPRCMHALVITRLSDPRTERAWPGDAPWDRLRGLAPVRTDAVQDAPAAATCSSARGRSEASLAGSGFKLLQTGAPVRLTFAPWAVSPPVAPPLRREPSSPLLPQHHPAPRPSAPGAESSCSRDCARAIRGGEKPYAGTGNRVRKRFADAATARLAALGCTGRWRQRWRESACSTPWLPMASHAVSPWTTCECRRSQRTLRGLQRCCGASVLPQGFAPPAYPGLTAAAVGRLCRTGVCVVVDCS